MAKAPLPWSLPIVSLVLGTLLALTVVVRPNFLWGTMKMRFLRRTLGDGGVTVLLGAFALLLLAMGGLAIYRKLQGD